MSLNSFIQSALAYESGRASLSSEISNSIVGLPFGHVPPLMSDSVAFLQRWRLQSQRPSAAVVEENVSERPQPKALPLSLRPDPLPQPAFAHGAFGGLAPPGDVIVVNFYVDHWGSPDVSLLIQSDGSAREQISVAAPVVERTVVARLLLAPPVARAVGEWLVATADQAVRALAGRSG